MARIIEADRERLQVADAARRDWAAIEQAGIDEPVNHAEPQAELEAASTAKTEADDAELEI